MKIGTLAPVLVFATAAQVVQAKNDLENVLVTGTYSPQPALTASVSTLDYEQISALNKRTLAEVLQTLPGVLVEEQGGPGGLTAVSIRGGEANFTLVLIDGVSINDPTNSRGGGFDFANLDTTLVERIEVVRGAQSSVYGSDALGGVINIITRRPTEGHTQTVRAEAGQDDFHRLGFSALGSSGAFDYTLELATRDDGDPVPGSGRESDSANLRLGFRPGERHELTLHYRYLDGNRNSYPEQSGGPEYAVTHALDESDHDEQLLAIGWEAGLLPGWQSRLTASRFEHEEDYRSPGIDPYFEVPPNASDTDFTRDQLQWVNTLSPDPAFELNLGADFRHEDGESKGYLEYFGSRNPTDFDLDRDVTGLFAAASTTPLDALLLQASVRRDNPDEFDSETSWRAGARYTLGAGVSLYSNWGNAYKLPSFFALGNALVGNPGLQPEHSDDLDAGIVWQATPGLRLEATWFFNDFKDLVDFDEGTFRFVNRQNVETSGVELQAAWQVLPTVGLRAQGTYTDIEVKNEDSVLTGRPEWTASLVAEWRLTDHWDTVLDYQYTGKQWAVSRHTGQEVTGKLADYHRVDWVLLWSPVQQWQFQLAADNLLNEDYETAVGFVAPERSLRLALRFTH